MRVRWVRRAIRHCQSVPDSRLLTVMACDWLLPEALLNSKRRERWAVSSKHPWGRPTTLNLPMGAHVRSVLVVLGYDLIDVQSPL